MNALLLLYFEDQECKGRYCYNKTECSLIGKSHFSYTRISTVSIAERLFNREYELDSYHRNSIL